jgi:hypothetical protein
MSKETNKKLSSEEISKLRADQIRALNKENAYLEILHKNEKLKSEIDEFRFKSLLYKVKYAELTQPPKKEE